MLNVFVATSTGYDKRLSFQNNHFIDEDEEGGQRKRGKATE